jgi:hypothetical protein
MSELARLRHAIRLGGCPLIGAERKWLANNQNGAFDPVRPASWFETVKMRLLTTRILALWSF